MIMAIVFGSWAVGFIGGMITEYLIVKNQSKEKKQK